MRDLKIRSILFETSISAIGKRCCASSTTVVSTPKFDIILAHSIPIAPDPIIRILFGRISRFRISSDDSKNSWSNSRPLTRRGDEPAAQIIFLQLYVVSPA